MKCTIVFQTIVLNLINIFCTFGCPFGWRPIISKGAMISCSSHPGVCKSVSTTAACKQARWTISESLFCCVLDIRDVEILTSAINKQIHHFSQTFALVSGTQPPTTTTSSTTSASTSPITTTTTTTTVTSTTTTTTTTTHRPTTRLTTLDDVEYLEEFNVRQSIAVNEMSRRLTTTTATVTTPSTTISVYDVWLKRKNETVTSFKYGRHPAGENYKKTNVFNLGTEMLHVGSELLHVGSELLHISHHENETGVKFKKGFDQHQEQQQQQQQQQQQPHQETSSTKTTEEHTSEEDHFRGETLLLPRKNGPQTAKINQSPSLLLPQTVIKVRPPTQSPEEMMKQNVVSHVENLYEHGKMLQNNFSPQLPPTPEIQTPYIQVQSPSPSSFVVDTTNSNSYPPPRVNLYELAKGTFGHSPSTEPPPVYSMVRNELFNTNNNHNTPPVYSMTNNNHNNPPVYSTATNNDPPVFSTVANNNPPVYSMIQNELFNTNNKVDEYYSLFTSTVQTPVHKSSNDVDLTRLYLLPDGVTQVVQLIEGKKMQLLNTRLLQLRAYASVTLLRTAQKNILVDAGWPMDKYLLINVLRTKMNIDAANDIHHVVITKDGVDTMGAVSEFRSADVITPHVYIKQNHAWKHPAMAGKSWYLDDGIVITPSAGIFGREISVLVKNAIGFGRVAIVGRLFAKVNGKTAGFMNIPRSAFLRRLKNRRKIVCNVDWVVPIYDKMFKVTKMMQRRAGCPTIDLLI